MYDSKTYKIYSFKNLEEYAKFLDNSLNDFKEPLKVYEDGILDVITHEDCCRDFGEVKNMEKIYEDMKVREEKYYHRYE